MLKDVGYLTASIIERIENDKFKKNKLKIKDFLQLKKDKNGIFAFYDKKIHLIKNYSNDQRTLIFLEHIIFSVEKDYQLSANLTNLIKQNLKKIDSYRK